MTSFSEFTSAAVSDRGLNAARPHNEDSFLELRDIGLFAVADGVGGAQAGEVASQMAVEILGEAFTNMSADSDPEDMMRIALDRANEAIYQMSHELPQLSSMATTIAALHVNGDIATIAHVGDSRVYRIDPNGRLFRETDDHSLVEEEVRAGRMTPEQAVNHPSRNVISRALGADDTVEADIRMVLVHPGTTFLLCSDGVTRHIDDSEIESILRADKDPNSVCSKMKEVCFDRGAEDNLTAVIVHFPGVVDDRMPEAAVEDEVTVAGVRGQGGPVEESLSTSNSTESREFIDPPANAGSSGAPAPASLSSSPADDLVDDDEVYLIQEPGSAYRDTGGGESDGNLLAANGQDDDEKTADPVPAPPPSSSSVADRNSAAGVKTGGGIGAGTLIAGFLLGIIAGLAGGYYYAKSITPAPPPVISEQKSNNVPLTSFEETRRLVDADPVKYLNANAATPLEADDYFWLGRALLLTGKPVEARRALEEARKRLPDSAEQSNFKTMSNEISMGLIIAGDPELAAAFAKEVTAEPGTAAGPAKSNGINAPIR